MKRNRLMPPPLLLLLAGCFEKGGAGRPPALSSTAGRPADGGGTGGPADLSYMRQWTGACCGLVCKAGQLCVEEKDGVSVCSLIDGGTCNQPGICGTCLSFEGRIGCEQAHHARCVDYPPSCLASPTCACLAPKVEGDSSGNCHQRCNDSELESAGRLSCAGL